MFRLTQHMKQVLKDQPLAFVATCDNLGQPNVSPKIVTRILGEDGLVLADLVSAETQASLSAHEKVAVAVAVTETLEGYQFKGRAELLREGPLFDEIAGLLERAWNGPKIMELPFEKAAREVLTALSLAGRLVTQPNHVMVLHIAEAWNLTPGHETEVWREERAMRCDLPPGPGANGPRAA